MTEKKRNSQIDGLITTQEALSQVKKLVGLSFTQNEWELMQEGVHSQSEDYAKLRELPLANSVAPALQFMPQPSSFKLAESNSPPSPISLAHISVPQRPSSLEDIAFWPVTKLARLLQTGQVSSVELTEMYLARLKR